MHDYETTFKRPYVLFFRSGGRNIVSTSHDDAEVPMKATTDRTTSAGGEPSEKHGSPRNASYFRGLLEYYGDDVRYGKFGIFGNIPNLITCREVQKRNGIADDALLDLVGQGRLWPQVKLPEPIWLRRIPCHLTNILHKGTKDFCDRKYSVNKLQTFDENLYRDAINSYWAKLALSQTHWTPIEEGDFWVGDLHYATSPLSDLYVGVEQLDNVIRVGQTIINNITIPILSRTDESHHHLLFERFMATIKDAQLDFKWTNLIRIPYDSHDEQRPFIYASWEATLLSAGRLLQTNSISESKIIAFIEKNSEINVDVDTPIWSLANTLVKEKLSYLASFKNGETSDNARDTFFELLDLSCYMDKWIPALQQQIDIKISIDNFLFGEDQLDSILPNEKNKQQKTHSRALNVRSIVALNYESQANKILIDAARKLLVELKVKGERTQTSLISQWITQAARDLSMIKSQIAARETLGGHGPSDDPQGSLERYLKDLIYKTKKQVNDSIDC